MVTETVYAENLARRAQRRADLVRFIKSEKAKVQPLNERMKRYQDELATHTRQESVLEPHARQGSADATRALTKVRDLRTKAEGEIQSTQEALAGVRLRVADHEAEIKAMDQEPTAAPADRLELDGVLKEIRGA